VGACLAIEVPDVAHADEIWISRVLISMGHIEYMAAMRNAVGQCNRDIAPATFLFPTVATPATWGVTTRQ
jgi:hypothetical protein